MVGGIMTKIITLNDCLELEKEFREFLNIEKENNTLRWSLCFTQANRLNKLTTRVRWEGHGKLQSELNEMFRDVYTIMDWDPTPYKIM